MQAVRPREEGKQAALERVRSELSRRGLLLMADRALPALTTVVAEEPIQGAWWSHPRARAIHAAAQALHSDGDVVVVPLVAGKVTFVHRRLWPALLGAAAGQARTAGRDLGECAVALRNLVSRRGDVRLDSKPARDLAGDDDLREAGRALGARLLVVADQVHTESGVHAVRLRSWSRWRESVDDAPERLPPRQARAALEEAVAVYARETGRQPRLPWHPKRR